MGARGCSRYGTMGASDLAVTGDTVKNRFALNIVGLAAVAIGVLLVTGHAPDSSATKPQYGAWGYDAAGADKATKPGDDFFRFANGTWLDHTQIPPDKPDVSLRLAMTDRTEGRLHDMMEAAAAKTSRQPVDLEDKVGAFYKA